MIHVFLLCDCLKHVCNDALFKYIDRLIYIIVAHAQPSRPKFKSSEQDARLRPSAGRNAQPGLARLFL